MNSSFPTGRRSTMKVEVSCFVGGMVIKEIVHVDKFEDADKVAKSRNPFCRVVNRKVLMKWIDSSMSLPPHFIDAKKKEVVFHIKGGHPVTMKIATWMKSFPDEYKGISCRCEETFYKLRAKVNEGWTSFFLTSSVCLFQPLDWFLKIKIARIPFRCNVFKE